MDAARARTKFYRFHAARSIADNAGKTDATLTRGGRGGFCYAKQQKPCRKRVYRSSLCLYSILSWHRNARMAQTLPPVIW